MEFTSVSVDQTTAITDWILGGVALGCAGGLWRARSRAPFKVSVWACALGLMGAAALMGGVRSGVVLGESLAQSLKLLFNLCLGLTVSLFAVGVVVDRFSEQAARKALPLLVLAGLGFFALTSFVPGSFLVFLGYEALALLFALGAYLSLIPRLSGARSLAAGIALSIVAAAVQATKAVSFTLIWAFDANGVFHMMQAVAVVLIVHGLSLDLEPAPPQHSF